jgi:Uma2 family endonuclease
MDAVLTDAVLPSRLRPVKRLSADQLFEFCARNEMLRIEQDANGELILMSPSGLEGDGATVELTTELTLWARQDGRGKSFGDNAGFTLPDGSMRSPDAAWMSWERWNALSARERERFGRVVPEFVVELRSKSDRLADVREKMKMWIGNGVELAWLIDPERRVVEVYRAGEAAEVWQNPTSVPGTGCVSGFCLVMERIWPPVG